MTTLLPNVRGIWPWRSYKACQILRRMRIRVFLSDPVKPDGSGDDVFQVRQVWVIDFPGLEQMANGQGPKITFGREELFHFFILILLWISPSFGYLLLSPGSLRRDAGATSGAASKHLRRPSNYLRYPGRRVFLSL